MNGEACYSDTSYLGDASYYSDACYYENDYTYDVKVKNVFTPDAYAEKYDRIISEAKCKKKEDDCSICLQPLFMKSVNYLPCKHYFHTQCLNQAVESKLYTCPLCRYNLVQPLLNAGFVFSQDTAASVNTDTLELWNQLLLSLLMPPTQEDSSSIFTDVTDVTDDFFSATGSFNEDLLIHDYLIFVGSPLGASPTPQSDDYIIDVD